MEEHLNPLAVTHLLQHTLRSLCIHENSQWVYAVFWRILPRNYPPPKWDAQAAYDRSRGNRRNWILVWEDGFCNFAASAGEMSSGECSGGGGGGGTNDSQQHQGLKPELFFKMSHEIYNYGEGLIGKVASDHSHKWIYKEPNDQQINFLSSWHHSSDSYPRTWEAQFQSGIKTIALISVREGVVQLGAVHKETFEDSFLANFEDLSINEACNVQEDLDQRMSETGEEEAQPNNKSGELTIGESNVSTTSESLNSQIPTETIFGYPSIRMQQRWLLFLIHARKCKAPEPGRNCVIVQNLWKHMDNCAAPLCSYPQCRNTKILLNHFRYCGDSKCALCIAPKTYLRQQAKEQENKKKQASFSV